MLVPIVFILVFMLTLTGALLETSLLSARTALNDSVARYAEVAMSDGVADTTHGLATFVKFHGTAGPWPAGPSRSNSRSLCTVPVPSPLATPQPLCAFRHIITATITQASSATGEARAAGTDAALDLQASVLDEQRISAVVSVTISAKDGTSAGSRTRFLTYRVFNTAPYAILSGARDITAVDETAAAAQGDSGGVAQTRIHVRLTCATIIKNIVPFKNDQQLVGNAGLPWGNAAQAAYETPCTSSDVPADVFRDEQWHNGDTNSSGWTQ